MLWKYTVYILTQVICATTFTSMNTIFHTHHFQLKQPLFQSHLFTHWFLHTHTHTEISGVQPLMTAEQPGNVQQVWYTHSTTAALSLLSMTERETYVQRCALASVNLTGSRYLKQEIRSEREMMHWHQLSWQEIRREWHWGVKPRKEPATRNSWSLVSVTGLCSMFDSNKIFLRLYKYFTNFSPLERTDIGSAAVRRLQIRIREHTAMLCKHMLCFPYINTDNSRRSPAGVYS